MRKRQMVGLGGAIMIGLAGMVHAQMEELDAPAPDAAPDYEAPAAEPVMEPATPEPAMDPMAEMQNIQMQFQMISAQLAQIQEQTMRVQEVMDAMLQYEKVLQARMVELAPESAGDIEEADQLATELRSIEDPESLDPEEIDALRAKVAQYHEKRVQLRPLEEQAGMDPGVQEAQDVARDIMMETMKGIHPGAEDLMEQREQLVERYMELEQEFRQQQMQKHMQMEEDHTGHSH